MTQQPSAAHTSVARRLAVVTTSHRASVKGPATGIVVAGGYGALPGRGDRHGCAGSARARDGSVVRIGAAIARSLAGRGAHVVVAARTRPSSTRWPTRSVGMPSSSTSPTRRVDALLDRAEHAAGGPIDVLVNNAGTAEITPFALQPTAAIERQVQVNLNAVLALTRRPCRACSSVTWPPRVRVVAPGGRANAGLRRLRRDEGRDQSLRRRSSGWSWPRPRSGSRSSRPVPSTHRCGTASRPRRTRPRCCAVTPAPVCSPRTTQRCSPTRWSGPLSAMPVMFVHRGGPPCSTC